ncbi:MAG: GAF domain-containing protein, partial [Anaerolineae bacterium]|nr:GAF domain-containing protein [Anaerolineae bacterium]
MILDRASDLTEATFGHLQLVSEDGQELVLVTAHGATLASIGERLKLGESVTGKAAQENRIYRIPDVQSPEWAHLYRPYIPNMRSELAVPMSFEDRVVGVINIESADAKAFSEDDERLLKGLAKQAAIAIHNARLYEAIKRQSQHWQALCEASKAIAAGSAAERKQVLNRIVEQAVRCIAGIKGPKAVWAAIMLYDEAANELWFESVYPFKVSPELEARLGEGWFLDRGKAPGGRVGITGRTVLEKKPQRVEDVRNDPDYLEFDITIRSELDVPLLDGDRVIGVLSLESDQVGAFDGDDEQALEGLAELAVIAIKNAEQAEQLSRTHAVALMGAWGADIVHDVNREVGAIRRAVFLLQQRSELSGEVKERLQEIDRYAGNLALPELPEQAPESGRILEFRNASFLDEVIRAEVENLQPAHPFISFKLEQNCLRIQVAMHEQLLRRLLRHLIYNAIGAIPSDKGTHLVTIRTAVQGSLAEVQVEDTGKGVRSEIKPMLFQQPIPHEDDRPGRGLLLVRFLAEQHGGYARLLWSQPGEGACFAFGIPLAQPPEGSA